MTVDELIEELRNFDGEATVIVRHPFTYTTDKLIVRNWVYDPYDGAVMIDYDKME